MSPSSSEDNVIDKEKEFFVKDIPAEYDDWSVFHAFHKFGPVYSVRIPPSQASGVNKFGFVVMVNITGADNVRMRLVKRRLTVNKNVSFLVNDVRAVPDVSQKSHGRVMAPLQNTGVPLQRHRTNEKIVDNQNNSTKLICHCRDLPLKEFTKVKVVRSPYPPDIKEGFTFHVVRDEEAVSNEYKSMFDQLTQHCKKLYSQQSRPFPNKKGSVMIYFRDGVGYRALRTSPDSLYLVDCGETVEATPSMIYPISLDLARLPTMVSQCVLARTHWPVPTESLFTKYREVLRLWSEREKYLTIETEGYKKRFNVVQVIGAGGVNFASTVSKKGECFIDETPSPIVYSRCEMYALRKEALVLPESLASDKNVQSILIGEMNRLTVS